MKRFAFDILIWMLLATMVLAACAPDGPVPAPLQPITDLSFYADYLVKSAFEDTGIVQYCNENTFVDVNGRKTKVTVKMIFGPSTSVRVADLDYKNQPYHGYWAPSIIWLPTSAISRQYMAKSYVIVGTSEDFGWDPKNLRISQVLDGIPSGTVRLGMTNPSQADPAASLYLATGAEFVGETMLTSKGIDRLPVELLQSYFGSLKDVTANMTVFQEEVLKDRRVGNQKYNTYLLFEANLYQINNELVAKGLLPIQAYYLSDATTGAKFPLDLVNENARDAFTAWSKCASRSTEAINRLHAAGYRAEEIGYNDPAMASIFKSEWGLDPNMKDLPLRDYPRPDDIMKALRLYQTSIKPAQRVAFCLDYSGSMDSNGGHAQLVGYDEKKENETKHIDGAVEIIFDQRLADQHGLTVGPDDIYSVFAFESENHLVATVQGKNPDNISALSGTLRNTSYSGGTALFDCARDAVNLLTKHDKGLPFYDPNYPDFDPQNYTYGVYLLTDGYRKNGWEYANFQWWYASLPPEKQIRIYGVGLGDANLKYGEFVDVVNLGHGILNDGTGNLAEALKTLFSNR